MQRTVLVEFRVDMPHPPSEANDRRMEKMFNAVIEHGTVVEAMRAALWPSGFEVTSGKVVGLAIHAWDRRKGNTQ